MENTKNTLAADIATHWERCLDVNSSWREFTNSLAILNSLNILDESDCEFVADLMQDNELFEDEDYEEVVSACFEFASQRFVKPELIDCNDLTEVMESGLTFAEVIELATEYGVPAYVINDFAEV